MKITVANNMPTIKELAPDSYFMHDGDFYQKRQSDELHEYTCKVRKLSCLHRKQKIDWNTRVLPIKVERKIIEKVEKTTFEKLKVGDIFTPIRPDGSVDFIKIGRSDSKWADEIDGNTVFEEESNMEVFRHEVEYKIEIGI